MKHKKIILFLFAFVLLAQTDGFARKTIKVLAIGNSFSVDAAEAYLDDLAKAADVDLIIVNCNIGGCSLQRHWGMAKGDSAMYAYCKIINGDTVITPKQTLKHCLQDEEWDYITFQQVSHLAGLYETYFPYIDSLKTYVAKYAKNKRVKFALHQTWAYAANSTHSGFKNYDKNQITMYQAVVETGRKVSKSVGIKMIIPSGTAIQNGRISAIGDNFCRDGFHLSLGLGRYTAACVWFEKLTGKSVLKNTFKPKDISETEAEIARAAAHNAVKHPFRQTSPNH
ncbi:MAG: DUF4886 domain-containing protein [Paludibacteraceae bacterium]